MKRFKFNLERLLKIREHEEHEWEIKLGKAVSECVRIQTEIERRQSEISKTLLTRGSINNREEELLVMEFYKHRMNKEAGELRNKLVRAEKERDKVKADFLEVSKNRKILTKLKEKREKEYYKQQLKQEFNNTDEINNSRAAGHYGR